MEVRMAYCLAVARVPFLSIKNKKLTWETETPLMKEWYRLRR